MKLILQSLKMLHSIAYNQSKLKALFKIESPVTHESSMIIMD